MLHREMLFRIRKDACSLQDILSELHDCGVKVGKIAIESAENE
ncbi:hypothetical protein ACFPYJ_12265 [Paenibacillus solisilvae]|uniref:Uncharacterized protein n=1 Tax=Paenibacillus solisilvae TaxID=2486751 RepID=A0ABW0VVM8_9BACL